MAFSGPSVFPAHTSECVIREATHPLPIPTPEHRAAFLWATHKAGMPATPTGGPGLESQTSYFHQQVNAHWAAMFYPGSGTGPLFCSLLPFPFRLRVYWKWERLEILLLQGELALAGYILLACSWRSCGPSKTVVGVYDPTCTSEQRLQLTVITIMSV